MECHGIGSFEPGKGSIAVPSPSGSPAVEKVSNLSYSGGGRADRDGIAQSRAELMRGLYTTHEFKQRSRLILTESPEQNIGPESVVTVAV